MIDSDSDSESNYTLASQSPTLPSPTPLPESSNVRQKSISSNSSGPSLTSLTSGSPSITDDDDADADWESLINVWTDEKGLQLYEEKLTEFLSDTFASLPWPSLASGGCIALFPKKLATETPRLFRYALQHRSQDHVVDLLEKTIWVFHPKTWKDRKILDGEGEMSARSDIDCAKVVQAAAKSILAELLV